MTTAAIALPGQASFELSPIRHKDIKAKLHKDYGGLCSANVPVTELVFGDELQTQLNHIRVTNKISNTTSSSHPLRCNYYGQNFNQNGKQHNRPFFITSAADAEWAVQLQAILPPHVTCRPTTKEINPFVDVSPPLKVSEHRSLLPSLVEYYRLKAKHF